MVFKSLTLFARSRGPDEFWRKRKIFKLAAHYRNRNRNCYSITIRNVHRAMVFATKGRELKKKDMRELWSLRLDAACQEHNISLQTFREALARNNIFINTKVLSELAAWEPATFKSLAKLAHACADDDGFSSINDLPIKRDGVITRGMLKTN